MPATCRILGLDIYFVVVEEKDAKDFTYVGRVLKVVVRSTRNSVYTIPLHLLKLWNIPAIASANQHLLSHHHNIHRI